VQTDALEGPGDLAVTTDFREVLAPLLVRHGATDIARVFPELAARTPSATGA
jgi:hypothetical protein